MEDLGPETPCDPMGLSGGCSPSLKTVVLPPPVADDRAAGSAGFQEELSQSSMHLRSQGPIVN